MSNRRLTLILPMLAAMALPSCGPDSTLGVGVHGARGTPSLEEIALDPDGTRTRNLLPDPGFEWSLSDFHPPDAPSWIALTEDDPIAGNASLRLSLDEREPRTAWIHPLLRTTVRSATQLVVQAEARRVDVCRGSIQLCAEVVFEDGEKRRECARLSARRAAARQATVGVDLDRDKAIEYVGLAIEHRWGDACTYVVDEVAAVLTEPVIRTAPEGTPEEGVETEEGETLLSEPDDLSWSDSVEPSVAAAASVGAERPPLSSDTPMHPASFFYRDVSRAAVHPESGRTIAWMSQPGHSFDPSDEFKIDLSLKILSADDSVPLRAFAKTEDFFPVHCDEATVPVPPGGALEANPTYRCDDDGDCHLLVFNRSSRLLYEMWRGRIPNGAFDGPGFSGGCLAVWDATKDYGMTGRGADCTSADAAGFPIAPMLFTPEEVASGEIRHALRLVMPNRNIRRLTYVAPATHATSATSGPEEAPPYGSLFRLRSDFDINSVPSKGGKVIARALQRYGAYIADGGPIALTGASDHFSPIKWCNHDRYAVCNEDPDRLLHEFDLMHLRISDFELLDTGPPIKFQGECKRLFPTPTP